MSVKRILLWYFMLTKRLFHKISFWVLLLSIPFMIQATNNAMSGESGVITVILCCEDNSPQTEKIVENLLESGSVIRFKVNNDKDMAIEEVKNHKADAVWYFKDNFGEGLKAHAKHQSVKPVVTVYEREDSIPLQLSHEKLYGAIYSDFSYEVYENFVYTGLVDEDTVSKEEVAEFFDGTKRRGDIVKTETAENYVQKKSTYLLTPLRGIMSLMVVLCGLAAAMYFLKDNKEGRYNWMPYRKRIIPAFGQCLSAIVPSVVVAFVSLIFTDIWVSRNAELLSILLFAIASVGFCLFMCVTFKTSGSLGGAIPAIIIVMLAASPVFINIGMLKPIGMLMPTYYYLNSVYNTRYYLYFVYYILGVYGVTILINCLFKRR